MNIFQQLPVVYQSPLLAMGMPGSTQYQWLLFVSLACLAFSLGPTLVRGTAPRCIGLKWDASSRLNGRWNLIGMASALSAMACMLSELKSRPGIWENQKLVLTYLVPSIVIFVFHVLVAALCRRGMQNTGGTQEAPRLPGHAILAIIAVASGLLLHRQPQLHRAVLWWGSWVVAAASAHMIFTLWMQAVPLPWSSWLAAFAFVPGAGVLSLGASWAVGRGFSVWQDDQAQRYTRGLAMQVEEHKTKYGVYPHSLESGEVGIKAAPIWIIGPVRYSTRDHGKHFCISYKPVSDLGGYTVYEDDPPGWYWTSQHPRH